MLAKKIIEDERARIKSFLDDNEELVKSCENDDTIPGRVRPRLVNLSNCENVWFSGITFKSSPAWTFHMVYCDNIQTDHCVFESDGLERRRRSRIPRQTARCSPASSIPATTQLPSRAAKTPRENEIGRPCAHIKVFDCRIGYGHGICIGSEMSGGVEDVQIWDCDFANSLYGIEVRRPHPSAAAMCAA